MKRLISLSILTIAILVLAISCSKKQEQGSEKEFTIGFGVGTYLDQFNEGILPILEKQGYKVHVKTFSSNNQLNPAMIEGAIQASVFQSTAYMESINKKENSNLISIAFAPGAPQSLRSTKHKSLSEVKDGSVVSIPNDPVNQERAVRILEKLGWVKINGNSGDTTNFNINSVVPAKYKINFKILDSPQILITLNDVDFGIVNGNYIANAGQKISDGLAVEDTPVEHRIIVSIDGKNKDKEWAKALKAAYESKEFEAYIKSKDKYDGFILPEAWNKN